MTDTSPELADFGWSSHFAAQTDADALATAMPARVMSVHRDRLHVMAPQLDTMVGASLQHGDNAPATVGDWLLLDRETLRPLRVLARRSLVKRRAAGTGRSIQLIAANVDTLFIVTACNADFNIARIERYLALARESDVVPVVVLTKSDLAARPEEFVAAVRSLRQGLVVEALDGRDGASAACLKAWCGRGQTVALCGSSGVGKSTLINTLSGEAEIETQAARVGDDKGRHTTTARQLHRLPFGGWLLDTPGMRELQLTDVAAGIDEVFADLAELAASCRFSDCRHETEPGCAIKAAIAAGDVEADRVGRWRKLASEDARNSASLAERRAQERAFGKLAKAVITAKDPRR